MRYIRGNLFFDYLSKNFNNVSPDKFYNIFIYSLYYLLIFLYIK